jgi:hypothetical protein
VKFRNKLSRHVTKKVVFTVDCSVNQVCDGEHEFDGPTVAAVVREMKTDGWLDNFIIEDTENLACPACVAYCKESATDFDELDIRAGGNAK